MWAMVVKEFRQLRRDRRTVAMMVFLPVVLLVVFGYAASFDVKDIPTVVVGPQANIAASRLGQPFTVQETAPQGDRALAETRLRDGDDVVAVVTTNGQPLILIDGSDLFSARAAETALARLSQTSSGLLPPGTSPSVEVLFNPQLTTSAVLVPGLAGMILVFVGTLLTSLGVVRERQTGTLEQLAVMPFRPWDVILGKIAPYFLVAALDLALVLIVGIRLFDVPFNGNIGTLLLGSGLFLCVTLGLGVLISTVSENQGQAIQLAFMTLLPQILLSGLIFPVSSMAAGVRWISYLTPLTYFIRIARGVMLRDAPISSLWQPLLLLGVLGAVVLGLAMLRFRRDLAPGGRADEADAEDRPLAVGAA
jgi:ABC-type multidrug transport system permease subunit